MNHEELIKLFKDNTKLDTSKENGKSLGIAILLGLKEIADALDRYTEHQKLALVVQKKMVAKQEELVERLEIIEENHYDDNEDNDENEEWKK